MVIIRTLKNGIRVALEEIPYVRSISFGIWVKNGSRNERPHENGVSHYIEHQLRSEERRVGKECSRMKTAFRIISNI